LTSKAITIGIWLVTAAGIALVACWWMLLSAIASGPVSPVPSDGHIVPYNNHGTIQYMTEVQHGLLWELPVALVAILAIGMWLRRKRGRNEG